MTTDKVVHHLHLEPSSSNTNVGWSVISKVCIFLFRTQVDLQRVAVEKAEAADAVHLAVKPLALKAQLAYAA